MFIMELCLYYSHIMSTPYLFCMCTIGCNRCNVWTNRQKLYDRLIQDYLHVHYAIIFLFPLHYVCFLIYFILFVGFVVLLFLILIIHLLIDTLNIQEPFVFIQLKINKAIQSILHQFIFINMFNIYLIHTHY